MKLTASLHPVFYGCAVQDIEYGSKILHIKALEPLPNMTGVVDSTIEIITVKVKTPDGIIEKSALFTDYVTCSWLNRNSNQVSTPDVMKGERLLVWQDGDSENYYWETIDTDNSLRTREHVIFAFSNTNPEDRTDKILNFENCYIIEVDTRGKKIGIYTNKNDGEPYAYSIKLDTAKGNFKLNDDVGNHVLLDSANTVIELMNADKTQYRMDKEDILEKCSGNRTLIIGGDNTVIIDGENNVSIGKSSLTNIGDSNTLNVTAANDTIVGSNDYVQAAGIGRKADTSFGVQASVADFGVPVANFAGVVNMLGFSAGPGASAGSPPRGGGGYTGIITGTVLVTEALTVPTLNAPTINSTTIKCTTITGATGNFSDIPGYD